MAPSVPLEDMVLVSLNSKPFGNAFINRVRLLVRIEPSANRFCVRCCAQSADQVNCNSHQDRAGCAVAIPGTYDFPELGVSCT